MAISARMNANKVFELPSDTRNGMLPLSLLKTIMQLKVFRAFLSSYLPLSSHHHYLIDITQSLDFGIELCTPHDSRIDLDPPLRGRLPLAHHAANLIEKLASLGVNWNNVRLDFICHRGDLRMLKRVVELGATFETGDDHFGRALLASDYHPPSFVRKYLRGVIDLGCPLTSKSLQSGLRSCPSTVGILFSVLTDNEILSIDWMAVFPEGGFAAFSSRYVLPLLKELREKSTELALRNILFSISPPPDYYVHINYFLKYSRGIFCDAAEAILTELMKHRVPLEGEPLRQIISDGPHVNFLKGLQKISKAEKVSLLKLSDEVLREYLAKDIRREEEKEVVDLLIYFASCDRNVSSAVLQELAARRRTDPEVIKLRNLL